MAYFTSPQNTRLFYLPSTSCLKISCCFASPSTFCVLTSFPSREKAFISVETAATQPCQRLGRRAHPRSHAIHAGFSAEVGRGMDGGTTPVCLTSSPLFLGLPGDAPQSSGDLIMETDNPSSHLRIKEHEANISPQKQDYTSKGPQYSLSRANGSLLIWDPRASSCAIYRCSECYTFLSLPL